MTPLPESLKFKIQPWSAAGTVFVLLQNLRGETPRLECVNDYEGVLSFSDEELAQNADLVVRRFANDPAFLKIQFHAELPTSVLLSRNIGTLGGIAYVLLYVDVDDVLKKKLSELLLRWKKTANALLAKLLPRERVFQSRVARFKAAER